MLRQRQKLFDGEFLGPHARMEAGFLDCIPGVFPFHVDRPGQVISELLAPLRKGGPNHCVERVRMFNGNSPVRLERDDG